MGQYPLNQDDKDRLAKEFELAKAQRDDQIAQANERAMRDAKFLDRMDRGDILPPRERTPDDPSSVAEQNMLRSKKERPWITLRVRDYQYQNIGKKIEEIISPLRNDSLILTDEHTCHRGRKYIRYRIFDPCDIRPLHRFSAYHGFKIFDDKGNIITPLTNGRLHILQPA